MPMHTSNAVVTRGYTTCVAGVFSDPVNQAMPGDPPEFVMGASYIEIRVGTQRVMVPWTTGPLPPLGAHVTITVEAGP